MDLSSNWGIYGIAKGQARQVRRLSLTVSVFIGFILNPQKLQKSPKRATSVI
jgi:hypothetical protein